MINVALFMPQVCAGSAVNTQIQAEESSLCKQKSNDIIKKTVQYSFW